MFQTVSVIINQPSFFMTELQLKTFTSYLMQTKNYKNSELQSA